MNESRIIRIARGSGRLVRDVMDMLEEYKRIAKVMKKIPITKDVNPNSNTYMQQIIKALPPNLLKQMGGVAGLRTVMKQLSPKGVMS